MGDPTFPGAFLAQRLVIQTVIETASLGIYYGVIHRGSSILVAMFSFYIFAPFFGNIWNMVDIFRSGWHFSSTRPHFKDLIFELVH